MKLSPLKSNFKVKFKDENHPVQSFEVLRPSQPSGVMSSAVSLPNHTFKSNFKVKFKDENHPVKS